MRNSLLLASSLVLAAASSAPAQYRSPGIALEPSAPPALLASRIQPAPPTLSLAAVSGGAPRQALVRSSLGRALLHTVGGVVLGSGIGYFASQVAKSDWEKRTNDEFHDYRVRFAVGGAVVGGLGGLWVGFRPPVADSRRDLYSGTDANRSVASAPITQEEIAESGAANAWDLVQSRRPNWLIVRGMQSIREAGRVVSVNGTQTVAAPPAPQRIVYLDQARIGDMEMLRQMSVANLEMVEFLDAAAATFRFGAENSHGVILLSTIK